MKENHVLVEYGDTPGDSSIYEFFVSDRKVHETVIKMLYSDKDKGWTDKVRGKQAASLKDDGNGVRIRIDNKTINLNYSQMVEILLLLVYYYSDSEIEQSVANITKYKVKELFNEK